MTTTTTLTTAVLDYLRQDRTRYAHQITLSQSALERDMAALAGGYVVLTGGAGHPEHAYVVADEDDLRWSQHNDYRGVAFLSATHVKTPSGQWAQIVAAAPVATLDRGAAEYADAPTPHTGF